MNKAIEERLNALNNLNSVTLNRAEGEFGEAKP
jgi:hypothetical protein